MNSFEDTPPTQDLPTPSADDRHALFLKRFLSSEKEIFRYICALVPCLADAQDILQQTALALWRKFESFDDSQPFTPWACRFALIEVKEFARKSGRWQALFKEGLVEALLRRRESTVAEAERRLTYLAECLDKLPPKQRETVTAYYYDRKPVEEMARHAERTSEAVYKSLQRIRQALLDCVTAAVNQSEAQG